MLPFKAYTVTRFRLYKVTYMIIRHKASIRLLHILCDNRVAKTTAKYTLTQVRSDLTCYIASINCNGRQRRVYDCH